MRSASIEITPPHDSVAVAADLAQSRADRSLCESLARQISENGIGIAGDFFPTPLIAEAAQFARDAVESNNGEYVSFVGDDLPGFLLGEMGEAPWFRDLCEKLYRELSGKPPPDTPFYQVLRCLSGSTGRANSNYFHYDSYMLTILVPIVIPKGAERGSLILLPAARPVRRNYLVNAIEKMILDRKWIQSIIRRRMESSPQRLRVDLEPGTMYAFCGYRSLHTNEPCAEHDLRVTLLFHYGNPHEESQLNRIIHKRAKQPSGAV